MFEDDTKTRFKQTEIEMISEDCEVKTLKEIGHGC